MVAVEELAGRIHQTARPCRALGVSRATLYRRRCPQPRVLGPRADSPLDHSLHRSVSTSWICEGFRRIFQF